MATNIKLYPWFEGCRNLVFWQAIWFLYFQEQLSVAEAIALAAAYDIATAVLEVPSGYLSDRVGRRITLLAAMLATVLGALLIGFGSGFAVFLCAQVLFGTGAAFASGTNSALLYDSLLADGRENEVAWHEVQAWRFSFTALALSAFTGGWMATQFAQLPFLMSALAAFLGLILALWFREPERGQPTGDEVSPTYQFRTVVAALRETTLAWLFVLAVGMYVFSHIPFVFGQPFILQALTSMGLAADTPIASGSVIGSHDAGVRRGKLVCHSAREPDRQQGDVLYRACNAGWSDSDSHGHHSSRRDRVFGATHGPQCVFPAIHIGQYSTAASQRLSGHLSVAAGPSRPGRLGGLVIRCRICGAARQRSAA